MTHLSLVACTLENLKEDKGIELERIYIISEHQNKGYGRKIPEQLLSISVSDSLFLKNTPFTLGPIDRSIR